MRLVVASAFASSASPYLHRCTPEQVLPHKVSAKSRELESFLIRRGHTKFFCNHNLYLTPSRNPSVCATPDSKQVVPTDNAETYDSPPPGCSRLKVELNKPLGIVLEEDKAGNIFVAEVVKGGNADKSGLIDVGDQLIATSAIVYGTEDYYQGVKVRKGMQIVRLSTFGEKFETVMAAIGTHPAYVKVALEIQKCQRTGGKAENNGAAN